MKNKFSKWLALILFGLASLAYFGCGNDNAAAVDEEGAKTGKSGDNGKDATPQTPPALSKEKAQAAANDFFRDLTLALRYDDPDRALTLVAKDYQYNFEFVYTTLQGCQYSNPKVAKVSAAGDLIDVQVSLRWPSGQRETVTKQLKKQKRKWVLLEGK